MDLHIKNGVTQLLRFEGAVVLLVACFAYSQVGGSWKLFVLLFLVPDVSFLAYLAGSYTGAVIYNLAHTYAISLVVLLVGFMFSRDLLVSLGLIWCAHIGFDRMLGYGLKYSTGFNVTHLGKIGKGKS